MLSRVATRVMSLRSVAARAAPALSTVAPPALSLAPAPSASSAASAAAPATQVRGYTDVSSNYPTIQGTFGQDSFNVRAQKMCTFVCFCWVSSFALFCVWFLCNCTRSYPKDSRSRNTPTTTDLPKDVFKQLQACVTERKPVSADLADRFAQGLLRCVCTAPQTLHKNQTTKRSHTRPNTHDKHKNHITGGRRIVVLPTFATGSSP